MYVRMYEGALIIEFRGGGWGGTTGYYATGATYVRTIRMGEIFFEMFIPKHCTITLTPLM
jgi:hypothetical protein